MAEEFIEIMKILLSFLFVEEWINGLHLQHVHEKLLEIFPNTRKTTNYIKNLLNDWRKMMKGQVAPFRYLLNPQCREYWFALQKKAHSLIYERQRRVDIGVYNQLIALDLGWDDDNIFDWNETFTKELYEDLTRIDPDIFEYSNNNEQIQHWMNMWQYFDSYDEKATEQRGNVVVSEKTDEDKSIIESDSKDNSKPLGGDGSKAKEDSNNKDETVLVAGTTQESSEKETKERENTAESETSSVWDLSLTEVKPTGGDGDLLEVMEKTALNVMQIGRSEGDKNAINDTDIQEVGMNNITMRSSQLILSDSTGSLPPTAAEKTILEKSKEFVTEAIESAGRFATEHCAEIAAVSAVGVSTYMWLHK